MKEKERIEKTITEYIESIHEKIGALIIQINQLNAEIMFVSYLRTFIK